MLKMFNRMSLSAAVLATWGISLPAAAQQSQQDDRQQYQQDDRQQDQQDDQQARQRQQQRRQQQMERQRQQQIQRQRHQQDRGQRFALQPEGWVTIAIDRDQDGRFDTTERIYIYDLVQARQRSAQRRGEQGRQQQMARGQQQRQQQMNREQQQRQQTARGQQQSQRQRMQRISGQVTELRTFRLSDGQQHRLAKVETQQGQTVPVDLGRVEQLQQLSLQEGDQVTIIGTRARINDRPVVCARRIQTGDQQVTVGRERDRGLKRVRGQIANVRTTRFRDRDQQLQVARVRLRDGRTETVILGPQDRLQNLDLQQGDQVQLLVRPARLNNEMALVAEQVRANERVVRVQEPEGRRFTARQQQQRQGQRQQQQRQQQ